MVAGVQAVLYRPRVSYLPQQCMTFLLTPHLVQLIEQLGNRSGFESYLFLMVLFKGVRSSSVAVVSHQKTRDQLDHSVVNRHSDLLTAILESVNQVVLLVASVHQR